METHIHQFAQYLWNFEPAISGFEDSEIQQNWTDDDRVFIETIERTRAKWQAILAAKKAASIPFEIVETPSYPSEENALPTPPTLPENPEPSPTTEPETTDNTMFDSQKKPTAIHLPNAKDGEAYVPTIHWENLLGVSPETIEIDGLAAVGLHFEAETRTIVGTPTQSGEYEFSLRFLPVGAPTQTPLERMLKLFVNPDPWSLWKEEEPAEGQPFTKAHTDQKAIVGWDKTTIVAASKRGRAHAQDGRWRDDDFVIEFDEKSGWYFLAVADGAGSAKFSREGARIACQTSVRVLMEDYQLTDANGLRMVSDKFLPLANLEATSELLQALQPNIQDALKKAVDAALADIAATADGTPGAALKDFSTTLLLAVARKFPSGWLVASFWVGDGMLGIYFDDKDPVLLGEPDSGEFSGQTRFLTMPEILADENSFGQRLRITVCEKFSALVLATDGISDAKFQTDANLKRKEKWDEFMVEIRKATGLDRENPEATAQKLLDWLDFRAKGEYDDRTIAILF